MMRCISLATFLIVFFSWTSVVAQSGKCADQKGEGSTESSLPATLYQEWRISPAPAHGKWVDVNPPALLWPSEKKNNNQDVSYRIFLSKDPEFPESTTLVSDLQKFCFYNPHKKLEPGVWHWKYDIIGKNGISRSPGTYAFKVSNETPVFETPVFEEVLARINTKHPRIMNQGHTMEQIRKKAPLHPLYKSILQEGEKALKAEIYKGPVTDKNPAAARSLAKTAGNEVERYHHLLEAYVLSGNKQMLTALLARTRIFLSWPTDDLLGSKVLSALAVGYDLLYDELSNDVKAAMLTVIANQIEEGLAHWPGFIEARQVENHFWQMELAGNYIAALATVHDLPVASRMLEYTYELFLARFPNLATQEGGWAEGLGYFNVNKSAIVDMAVLMKKVGGVDVFQMNWYQNLADLYTYFAPVEGRIAGFGDMHDRVGNGDVGHAMMLVVGEENQDQNARYRLATLLNADKEKENKKQTSGKDLKNIEPWYQIVNDIHFDPDEVKAPMHMKMAKVFYGTGEAALHTDVLKSENNTALYFRASPFGAKGHMHANQNCFNLSRKGEAIFYSTGYYTSFADSHSLTSYRHTRAHNGILVNGCGQAFGHEGYGWIKRFINGENISYVCGDATKAYRPTVDKQFLELTKKNGIDQTPDFGFADSKLKVFERHMVLLHPNTVVIYDVLESEEPADWSFLLHAMQKPQFNEKGVLELNTDLNVTKTSVFGSQQIETSITDQFYSQPIDFKKKYKETPNQFHITCKTQGKTTGMRFLAVIQMTDKGMEIPELISEGNGQFAIGDIQIQVELDVNKPADLTIVTEMDQLYINNAPANLSGTESDGTSVLVEEVQGEKKVQISKNRPPVY